MLYIVFIFSHTYAVPLHNHSHMQSHAASWKMAGVVHFTARRKSSLRQQFSINVLRLLHTLCYSDGLSGISQQWPGQNGKIILFVFRRILASAM